MMRKPEKYIELDSDSDSQKLFSVYKRLIKRINELLEKGYKEESIILTVTIFEVLFKISFKTFKDHWLSRFPNSSAEEKIEYRNAIREYLEKMNLYDEYLRNYHIYQNIVPNPEIESLYDTLFGKSKGRKINFQTLNEKNGVNKAFLAFFNFDISKNLDQDSKKSQYKWNLLNRLFEERHNIIHNGGETTLTSQQISEILDSTDYLIEQLRFLFASYTIETEDLYEAVQKGHLGFVETDMN
jgi:hypothetical protein